MFLELIATFVAGFAAAGVVLLLNKILRGALPRWAMPVVAGLAMIGFTIYNEYNWFARTKASLPEGLVIVETVQSRAFYRPWTYAHPFVERFVAVDQATIKTHEGQPGQKLADVYLFGRWAPVHKVPVLADCAGNRQAALTDAVSFEADGAVTGADWTSVSDRNATQVAICGET